MAAVPLTGLMNCVVLPYRCHMCTILKTYADLFKSKSDKYHIFPFLISINTTGSDIFLAASAAKAAPCVHGSCHLSEPRTTVITVTNEDRKASVMPRIPVST